MANDRSIAQELVARLKASFPGQLNVSGLESISENLCFKCSFDRQFSLNTLYVYIGEQSISWRIVSTNDVHERPLDGSDPIGEAADAISSVLQEWSSM
jgi:hypothetical protein